MTTKQTTSTSNLWNETHNALCSKSWSKARALLDDLGLRSDNRDLLLSARQYGVPEMIYNVIQDRIDLVNTKAA